MANNALAPNIDNVLSDYVYAGRKLKEQRTNNLLNPQVKTAMTLADLQALKGAPTQRTPTLGERVEGLSYAAGEGFKDQLEGFKQMLTTNPKDTLMAMYEGLKHVVQDPGILADMGKQAVSSPENFTRFLAQNLNPMDLANVLNKVGTMRELTVYHGTPHTLPPTANNPLGEFDASKIGTGTGTQAFGHGIYVAENPEIAKTYVAGGSPDLWKMAYDEGLGDLPRSIMREFRTQSKVVERNPQQVIRQLKMANADARSLPDEKLENLVTKWREANKGNLYTVDLPDEKIGQMLDWGKPLSEHPESVQKAVNDYAELANIKIDPKMKGSQIYNLVYKAAAKGKDLAFSDFGKSQKLASDQLRWAGIPGIVYDADTKTRNFVVFPGEEKSLKILKRE